MITMLQDKLLAKMDNEVEEKMPYSADDQVLDFCSSISHR